MRDAQSSIEERGAELFVVGNGAPHFAKAFAKEVGFDEDRLLTDPDRALYRALGMKRGLRHTVSLSSALNAGRALRGGFRQTGTKGDPWQQGGAIVVSKAGELCYLYTSQVAGDHPPVSEILDAIPS